MTIATEALTHRCASGKKSDRGNSQRGTAALEPSVRDRIIGMGFHRHVGALLVQTLTMATLSGCETIGSRAETFDSDAGAPQKAGAFGPLASFTCESFGSVDVLGELDSASILEASSLVASRTNPGVLWTANDSGGGNKIFAVSSTGHVLATYTLTGAGNVDWEDMALGLSSDGHDVLYIGDIGDNSGVRKDIDVYRVTEPDVPAAKSAVERPLDGATKITLVYPGIHPNSETLLIDRASGDLLLLTREFGSARIFRAPAAQLVAGARILLEEAGRIVLSPGDAARGGSSADTGDAIALRTTFGLHLFTFPKGMPLSEALQRPSCSLSVGAESRGEAVAFAPFATGYFTLGEGINARLQYVRRY